MQIETIADSATGQTAEASPVMTAAMPRGALSTMGEDMSSWLGGGTDPLAPAAAPLAWAGLAVSRRKSAAVAAAALPAAAVTTSQAIDPAATSSPITPGGDLLRYFIGDGTADNPDAGILYGNGYSYTVYEGACTTGACDGGNGGLIGNGATVSTAATAGRPACSATAGPAAMASTGSTAAPATTVAAAE